MTPAIEQRPQTPGRSTLGAISAVSFIVACVAHEAIGHGGMCLAVGGRIRLLTSVYFSGTNGGPLTDAAGPLMNLVAGAVCLALARGRPQTSLSRLFFTLAMAFNFFWGGGYFIFSAVTNTGDWAFVLRELSLEPAWFWRCLMGALGVVIYARSMRVFASTWRPEVPLVWPYLAAGAVACVSVLFFSGPVLPALREAAQESFVANVGLLGVAYRRRGRTPAAPSQGVPADSGLWIAFGALATVLFFLTLGRGFVSPGHA